MKRSLACIAIVAAAAVSASAQGLEWWSLRLGETLVLNMDTAGGPSPIGTFAGVQFSVGFAKEIPIVWEPSIDATIELYEWTGSRAVPTEIEHRQAWSPTLILDSPFMLRIQLGEGFGLSVGGGVLAVLGFGFQAVSTASQSDVDAINAFNLSLLRIFSPELQVRFDAAIFPGSTIGIGLRYSMPVLGILDPSCPSIFDRSRADLFLSVRFQ